MSLVAIQWKDLDQQLFIDKGWLIKLWVSKQKKKAIWANKKKGYLCQKFTDNYF